MVDGRFVETCTPVIPDSRPGSDGCGESCGRGTDATSPQYTDAVRSNGGSSIETVKLTLPASSVVTRMEGGVEEVGSTSTPT